jgi:hypothetical protein
METILATKRCCKGPNTFTNGYLLTDHIFYANVKFGQKQVAQ